MTTDQMTWIGVAVAVACGLFFVLRHRGASTPEPALQAAVPAPAYQVAVPIAADPSGGIFADARLDGERLAWDRLKANLTDAEARRRNAELLAAATGQPAPVPKS